MFQESMQKAYPTQTWIKDKPLGVTSYTTLPPWLSQLVNKRKHPLNRSLSIQRIAGLRATKE